MHLLRDTLRDQSGVHVSTLDFRLFPVHFFNNPYQGRIGKCLEAGLTF